MKHMIEIENEKLMQLYRDLKEYKFFVQHAMDHIKELKLKIKQLEKQNENP